ncbi:MAG: radical SAM protein [Clostridium sp.]
MNCNFDYHTCNFCPRNCGVNRYEQTGYCKSPAEITVARAALHMWEEPCISGIHGSGTIFFSGCTLRCCFCQNYKISSEGFGKIISTQRLSEIFLELQEKGAHNINLVTATQYLPSVIEAIASVKEQITIPFVYNCGGYETTETIQALAPYVDIWLPDLKYFDSRISDTYSGAPDYFEFAQKALQQMIRQTGSLIFEDFHEGTQRCSLMKKGVIIRHMVLPGQKEDSIRLMHRIHDELPEGGYMLSLLSQYTPFYKSKNYPEINRRITTYEYEKVLDTAISLGLTTGFMQEKSSAREEYTPPFELEGV